MAVVAKEVPLPGFTLVLFEESRSRLATQMPSPGAVIVTSSPFELPFQGLSSALLAAAAMVLLYFAGATTNPTQFPDAETTILSSSSTAFLIALFKPKNPAPPILMDTTSQFCLRA